MLLYISLHIFTEIICVSSALCYTYSCPFQNGGSGVLTQNYTAPSFSDAPVIKIDFSDLLVKANAAYKLTVVARKGSRTASAHMGFLVVSGRPPLIELAEFSSALNWPSTIVLKATITSQENGNEKLAAGKYSWSSTDCKLRSIGNFTLC